MKKISAISQLIICLLLTVFGLTVVNGQVYKPGDLYTFQDGSKGIVFYVDPDNPNSGTVAALRDLDGTFALWTGSKPQSLTTVFVPNESPSIRTITGWTNHGKNNTLLLALSGASPAANAITADYTVAGWYIPDAMQLYNLYASVAYLSDAFEAYGGDLLSLWSGIHWSSTCVKNSTVNAYTLSSTLKLGKTAGTSAQNMRLVRDFPEQNEIQLYWADSPYLSDTVVSPEVTTDYVAILANGSDTLSLTAIVTVKQPTEETLYEKTYASTQPYTSSAAPIFNGLDISIPGIYEYKETLTAANGCDSIVTLLLTVGNNVIYSDTLCPLKEDYYFAPFDTVFAVGTVSGLYEHHGTKIVDGMPVDTVAYYDLTILPVYERFDTISWCLSEPSETRQYDGNENVSVTVSGSSVSVTSTSQAVVVEEITPNVDFALRMQTSAGCDSIVFLHVDARRVRRDTVYADVLVSQIAGGQITVACHTFTGIDGPGMYRATDTLTADNGCDSLVTVTLIVETLHVETLCDSVLTADLTWQSPLADYTWNGESLPTEVGSSGYYEFSGQRIIDGGAVDTVSYLQLIVIQSYETHDTVSFCMEEASYSTQYDGIDGATISVAANGTATVTATPESGAEVIEIPGSTTDFALRMQTVSGCDSIVFLHVDARRVRRDTVRYAVFEHLVENGTVTVSGHTFSGITSAGTYEMRDTLTAANGCDSIVTLLLTVGNNVIYSDTLCPLKEDYYFAPFDTVFAVGTVSGLYEHHGTKTVEGLPVDTVAYYDLTILPVYERFDTISWCLSEPSETRLYDGNEHVSVTVNGSSVSVTSTSETVVVEEITPSVDFALRMQTNSGCDSIVFLHVDARRVRRDTVYADVLVSKIAGGQITVACHTFTGIDGPGTYHATDTLTSANGCDSIVTVTLIVEPLHVETLCDSVLTADLTWQSPLADYTWYGETLPTDVGSSGYYEFSGQRIIDGGAVDTVSYLQLVVNQSYEAHDTVSFCMEEATYSTQYDGIGGATISVAANGTATVTATPESGAEVIEIPGSTADFALRMLTVSGCDSIVFLHVDARRVQRDTVRYAVFEHLVENGTVTVSGHTFSSITSAGTYEVRDTLTAANGCDSIVIHELTVNPCASDFTIVCPPDVYDTLAYGDCVMTLYPERLGTPTVLYDGEWPFRVSSDIPEDSLFAQGDNIVIWTATDMVCGYSVTCEQHVVIAFPQCPDAVDFEGNVYHGVRIGCDCWTQRNLESRKYSDGEDITGKYAYHSWQHPDTTTNVAAYGRLYSFEAAVRNGADNGHGHIQGICPDGWFLPTPEHYEGLNEYGTPALRSPDLWIYGAGNNSTGFTALPAGFYNGSHNRFEGMLTETYFWSTKKSGESTEKYLYSVDYICDSVKKQQSMSGLGYSIRCVKE